MTAIARAGRVRRPEGQRHPFSHHSTNATRRRLAVVMGLLPVACGLMLGSAMAERAPAVTRVPAAEVELTGRAIAITRHDDLAAGLTEIRVPSATAVTRASGADRLLSVAPGSDQAAVAGSIGAEATSLIVARADGSQVQVELPGLIAATFAPDASWLAAIDGRGALWRVATADGAARQLAPGPFVGEPVVEPDASVLVLQVPSVEAPFRSKLVRVGADGSATTLTNELLVYGVQPLADGSLAVVAHRPSGTVVVRQAGGRAALLADLGADAVNVAVPRSGAAIAWERGGEIFLQDLTAGRAQRIAAGTNPRFSDDGQALLIDLPAGTQLIEPDGTLIAAFSTQLGFAACAGECFP
jgi:hypothetical protein